MKRTWALILLLVVAGCGTLVPALPGHIYETTSKFDGTKQLSMEPAWLSGGGIKLALYKNSKMPPDKIILTAVVSGIKTFSSGESLHFNIDGDFVSFKSIDELTDREVKPGFVGSGHYIPPSGWSSKRYIITKQFVGKLVEADRVIVKINFSKTYTEGEFSTSAPTTARSAFKKFHNKISEVFP